MSKTYRKLGRRAIKKNIARFLSIMIIVMLGSGFLVGLISSPWSMEDRTDAYLDEYDMYDIAIKSTLGITESDIEAIKDIPNVRDALGIKSTDLIMEDNFGEGHVTRISSIPYSNLELIDGRFPQKNNEVVLEIINPYAGVDENIKSLKVSEDNKNIDAIKDILHHSEYDIVGVVESPYFISTNGGVSMSGHGEIVLAVFSNEEIHKANDIYTDLYIQIAGAKELNAFAEEYENLIKNNVERIEITGILRSDLRTEEVKKEALDKLKDPKKEYEDAKAETYSKFEEAEAEFKNVEKKIADGESEIAEGVKGVETLRAQAAALDINDTAQAAQAATLIAQADATENLLNTKKAELKRAKAELAKGQQEFGWKKSSAYLKLDEAREEIEKAEKDIQNIESCEWLYFDRNDNLGTSGYKSNVDKIRAIAAVFPVFFFAVTMLVALTTMGRMIEEERLQIGALKAIGYQNKDILFYYISYSLTASVVGCVIGVVIGSSVFPMVIDAAYSMMYTLPILDPKLIPWIVIPVIIVILISVLLSTYFSCRSELKEKPAMLLLPKAPKTGKRILLEKIKPIWSRVKFSHKVTLRNIFRYKKRLLMTVIGIAGSFALLLTGFGLRDSIGDIVEIQYNEIYKFDFTSEISEEKWIDEDENLLNLLNNKEYIKSYAPFHDESVTVEATNEKTSSAELIIAREDGDMTKYYNLRNRLSGENIPFDETSLIVTEKMSEQLSLKVGDSIKVQIANGEKHEMKITGICENYVGDALYLSRKKFENSFDTQLEFLTIQAKANYSDSKKDDQLIDEFAKQDHVDYTLLSADIKSAFNDSVESINYIVILIIVCAGILVMVVLYNLININICERKKELATIEVLGFYNREIFSYIFRETNLLSLLGCVVGVPLGIILHKFVIHVAEVDGIMFGREINFLSYIASFIFAGVFILIVNRIMRRSIKKINMVESMKAND